tara:strand:+ start:5276 stop:11542 length:6267 start_codon:yes stop_codon:yes gene_type:complete
MPSPTDFNLSPYYDDFNESKKFHRILFRPSFAVQARELTQSQTILQNQVERFGDHVFKQGAMVLPGQVGIDLEYSSIKLTSKTATALSSYNGSTLTGNTSGVIAEVVGFSATDGTDPDTLFVKYNKGGTDNAAVSFSAGETVTSTALNSSNNPETLVVATIHTGSAASVESGVYYINGYFIQVDKSTVVLDKYTSTPSYRVGFTLAESFVTPNDDASINDNAQGTSNINAPGAHRFKIQLTLTKKSLTATDDTNFYEIARVENGRIKAMVRSTEYSVLEDTLARRTFDESGDYVLTNPDLDVREHLSVGNNRGIYTSASGGLETKLALGVSPFKAYVNGYEAEQLGTTFVDVDKAREFDTGNNNKARFQVGNFVYVNNAYNSPDIGFVSGDTQAFKTLNLMDTATAVDGTQQSTVGTTVPQIGRAKSRGFEFVTGTESNDIYPDSAVYKHYLFDIDMYTHINVLDNTAFTTGELLSGSSTGASGIVQDLTAVKSAAATSISVANPGVVTLNAHGFEEGQQITLSGGNFAIGGSAYTPGVFTVRSVTTNTFELYGQDGTTSQNVTAFTSGPTMTHGVIVLSNVKGTFAASEVVTGQTSNNSSTIQADVRGYTAVSSKEFSDVKQIGMAGSPAFTADTDLSSAYGTNTKIDGTLSVGASATVTGNSTLFNSQLRPGDSISFDNDSGTTITRIVKSIVSNNSLILESASSGTTTNATITRRRAKLNNPENNRLVFKFPYKTVKTLKTTLNEGLTDTNYSVRRQFTGTLSSGAVTISAGTNEVFSSANNTDYIVSIMTVGSGSTGAVGDILNISGSNHQGATIFTLGGSPTGKTLTLDFGTNFTGHKVKILATVNRTVAGSKSKTLVTNSTKQMQLQSSIEYGIIGLSKADIKEIKSVKMSANFSTDATASDTDITDRFTLDNGQRDNFYDIGRIKLKPGALTPTGRLLITFDFFSHGAGDYFDVDSYSGVVAYEEIPSYTSDTTGEKFELRDCLDFRPRVDDASTFDFGGDDRTFDGAGASTLDMPRFGSDITADLEFYLNRIDKLFLTREGQLKVIKGASDLNPIQPTNLDGHMLLATLNIPSYTLSTDEVDIEKEDNRRYTMRDIGKLENRIQNVEYYTQLSLLEADAQNLQIQDENGLDRFKNGFIVDNFTGHNIGDVQNNDYKLSIDRSRGEARTLFNEDVVELGEFDDDGTSIITTDRTDGAYQKTGDLLTLPYTETPYISQTFASKTENLNPFLVFNWIGDIDLNPPVDEWKETRRAPEVVANVFGSFDNMALARGLDNTSITEIPVGTEWNEWQDQWTGNPRTGGRWTSGDLIMQTTTSDVRQTRTGIRTRIVPQTVRQSLGDRVISIGFVPFIRSRTIGFQGYGLRPNVRVYPFFDNIDISTYVTPDGGSLGGNLVTDSTGYVKGEFAIPDPNNDANPRWRTGKRVFRLTSSSINSQDKTNVATSAEGDYDAKGLLETVQEAIISTREPRTERLNVTDSQTIQRNANRVVGRVPRQENNDDNNRGDPLAQSFVVDVEDGLFVTSINTFFATKSSTLPVKAEIRNMVNGYPGPKVLPFAQKWLNPGDINVSTDATAVTTFTFPSPVYLKEGVEYCIVLYTDSQDYTAYVARLGEKNLGSNRTISSQPNMGILFKSANNRTWNAEQMEDLKITINKAVFSTSTQGQITLCNKDLPSRTLANNPIRTFNGTGLIRIFHPNHGMHSANDNVTIAGVVSGTYNGIAHSSINGTYTSIKNITLDSYDIETGATANATGDVGGITVTATQNRLFDVMQLQIGQVTHPGTTLGTTLRTTTGRSVHGSESPFVAEGVSSAKNVVLGDNLYFTEPRMVASAINETNEMSNGKSMFVQMTLNSSNANLSPVIDLQRVNAFAISNRLNQPAVTSTDTFTGDGSTTAFTLSSTPTSVHLLSVKVSGLPKKPVDDFTVSGTTLTFGVAPASGAKINAKLSNTVDYEDDTAPEGGSSAGSYITKPVQLETPSTALDCRVAASVRSTSQIKMFFRLTGGEETRRLQDIEFTPFNTTGASDNTVVPSEGDRVLDNDFRDYKFSVKDLPEFTSFQIKIVFNGTNTSYTARIKDFRGIALAV